MWEWVQDVQKERKAQKAAMTQRARSGSGSIDVLQEKRSRGMSHGSAAAGDVAAKRLVYELTREEFEGLLFNFEM
jgi:formylglycine-generating enzyme required for sulfatase activity